MDIQKVYNGLQAKYKAAEISDYLSGLWLYMAPAGSKFPYAVLTPQPFEPDNDFTGRGWAGEFDIDIYFSDKTTAEEASRIAGLMMDCFKDAESSITIEGHSLIRLDCTSAVSIPDGDTNGFQYTLGYSFQIQEA